MAAVTPQYTPKILEELSLSRTYGAAVAGLDEAGRGAWAGPVYAAAVVLPLQDADLLAILRDVRDSKLLSPAKRERLLPLIEDTSQAVGVGWARAAEIDSQGIVPARQLAMRRALDSLGSDVDALLIDYLCLPQVDLPQRCLPKADMRCLSVAAASIVAKVSRDRIMVAMDEQLPGYDFASHKGYGTQAHRAALAKLGPCPIHRISWRPFQTMPGV